MAKRAARKLIKYYKNHKIQMAILAEETKRREEVEKKMAKVEE